MTAKANLFYPRNIQEWRAWLEKNHATEKKVYLLKYKKHTKKPSLTHQESMDEAICFGWIDTTVKRIDEERYTRCFVRRNENGCWSKATQSYARRLIKEGRMTPAGLKAYKEGLQKPTIDHNLPRNPATPQDLQQALARNKTAQEYFTILAPSYKWYYIYWIEKAKRAETRKKRITEVVKRCTVGKKPGI